MDPLLERPGHDDRVGRTIAGKFRIESLAARGSMGRVYLATHLGLNKTVAIKILHPSGPTDDGASRAYVARFKREAKAASRLDHPNSVRVIDFGEAEDGVLYMAMEFLEGRNLLTVLREEFPLSRERIVSILSQVLAALAVAHEMGVVHRDLKPENIMLSSAKDDGGNLTEIVKVCDFGIAKLIDPDASDSVRVEEITVHGALVGTPEYMSPEQARGEPADTRSDIYSLGVILYQLLTGRLPFVSKSKAKMILRHIEERPMRPAQVDSQVNLILEAICMKTLEKRPEDRFQSAREMRAALLEALGGDDALRRKIWRASDRPPAPAPPSSAPRRREVTETVASAVSPPSSPRVARVLLYASIAAFVVIAAVGYFLSRH